MTAAISNIRTHFPYLENTSLVYLNHAALGPMPDYVHDAMNSQLYQRHHVVKEDFEQIMSNVADARTSTAQLINAQPESIAFIPNTSHGLNLIARGIDYNKDDEILLIDGEFPSNIVPFTHMAKDRNVKVLFIPMKNHIYSMDQVCDAISPNTRLVSVSLVQYLSGQKADLQQLSETCQQNGTLLIIDGIQGAGVVPVDVQSVSIDGFVSGSHKWLTGPQGIGFIYASEKLNNQLVHGPKGWLSVDEPWQLSNYNQDLKSSIQRVELGMPNLAGIYGLGASAKALTEIGIANIRETLLNLTDELNKAIQQKFGWKQLSPKQDDERSGILTYDVGDEDAETLQQSFAQKNVILSSREGLIRVSPHFYQEMRDFERFVG